MIIDFKFRQVKEAADFHKTHNYEADFSIVGITHIEEKEIIRASQPGGSFEHIRQKILAELVALLQLDLYGRVLSNEKAASSNQPKPDSQTSQTNGGNNQSGSEIEATGSKRPNTGSDPTSADIDWEAEAKAAEEETD